MMRKITLLVALLCLAPVVHAQHRGRVFDDRNGNGRYDKGDRPLRGVNVSDGLHVCATDRDGRFELPGHARERFVFITMPSGYTSPAGHYRRVSPGGADEYAFGLTAYDAHVGKKGAHRFVQITDTEVSDTTGHGEWLGNLRDYVAAEGAAFLVHTGDICYPKGLRAHIQMLNGQTMGCPVYYAIGNHDLVSGPTGEALFESLYGPVYYSFDVGRTHYIVTPMPGGDYRPGYTRDDVCAWLRNDLAHVAPGTPIVVFNHDLPSGSERFIYKGTGEEADLDAHNLKAWIYGHWHINLVKRQGKVLTVCTTAPDKGGIDHSIGAFRVVDVDERGEVSTRLRYTYADHGVCIAAPGDTVAPGRRALTVNAYTSGAPTRRVTCRLLDETGRTVGRTLTLRAATDLSWTGTIDVDATLAGRTLTLQAEALFGDGRTAVAERRLTCTAAPQTPAAHAEWTNLLGNAAHAAPLDGGPRPPLRMAWTTNVGANLYMTAPVVSGGRVFVASVDEDLKGKTHLYALRATDGTLCWQYAVRNSIKNTIVVADGVVVAQDVEGWVYAVGAADGALRWEKKLPTGYLPALIEGIAAQGDTVYVGTGKALTAIEAQTGRALWTNDAWNSREGTTSTLTVGAGVVVTGSQWNALFANDARTGRHLWSVSEHGLRNRGASPAVHGGLLYLVSAESFFILDAQTGKTIVRRTLPCSVDVTSTPLLTDRLVVFGTATEGLMALDRETLDTVWTMRTAPALAYTAPYVRKPAATIETSPVMAGGVIYVAAADGTLYGVRAADGAVVWRHATGAPLFATPAVSGNALFVTDYGGNVYAFTPAAP